MRDGVKRAQYPVKTTSLMFNYDINDRISRIVKSLMKRDNIKGSKLSETLGLSENGFSKLLRCETNFTVAHLEMLAKYFRVSPCVFFIGYTEESTDGVKLEDLKNDENYRRYLSAYWQVKGDAERQYLADTAESVVTWQRKTTTFDKKNKYIEEGKYFDNIKW